MFLVGVLFPTVVVFIVLSRVSDMVMAHFAIEIFGLLLLCCWIGLLLVFHLSVVFYIHPVWFAVEGMSWIGMASGTVSLMMVLLWHSVSCLPGIMANFTCAIVGPPFTATVVLLVLDSKTSVQSWCCRPRSSCSICGGGCHYHGSSILNRGRVNIIDVDKELLRRERNTS